MSKKLVTDIILSVVGNSPISKKDLIVRVQKEKIVTVQAVYKELRKLTADGTLLFHGGYLSLNLMYISSQYSKWSSILKTYEGGKDLKSHFLDLQDDEYINLKFKTLNDLDAYWTHVSLILDNLDKPKAPSYSVIPHDWFLYARQETDAFWTKSQKDKMRLIVNSKLPLDKDVANRRIKNGYKINTGINPLHQKDNVYYTLINGYVLKITLDQRIHRLLLKFIQDTKTIKEVDQVRINKIINTKCTCVMKILNNRSKFEQLSNKCRKYFA